MSFTTKRYIQKADAVNAVQIAEENIYEIAQWCGGRVSDGTLVLDQQRGYVGDWILLVYGSFLIQPDAVFRKNYETMAERFRRESVMNPETHARNEMIVQLVYRAMRKASSSEDTFGTAQEVANKIFEILGSDI